MGSNVGDLLDILEHQNPERYAGQRIFVFPKTIISSRKATSLQPFPPFVTQLEKPL